MKETVNGCFFSEHKKFGGGLTGQMIEQGLTSHPKQYRLYGRRFFLQVARPNQQYQSTEGTQITQLTEKIQ